jgi:proteasome activator subunit 4
VLFDPKAASKASESSNDASINTNEIEMEDASSLSNGVGDEDPDASLDSSDEAAIKESFAYPTGYPLEEGDILYTTIHEIRERAGFVLHDVHRFLSDKQEDDVPCFGALYSAYRSWFVDVGIERSAHVLDRVTRLLAADIHPYKMSGVRKDYPRALLVRRANVYHLQRLRHNAAPRARSKLDELLLFDLAESCVSLYTETRRNAQNAGESALKCVWGARTLIIPPLLKALQKGVKENDHARIKGALFSLLLSSVAKTVGRNWKYTPALIRTFIDASAVDKPSVQKICSSAVFQIMDYGRAMERMAILDQKIVETIAPSDNVNGVIEKSARSLITSVL